MAKVQKERMRGKRYDLRIWLSKLNKIYNISATTLPFCYICIDTSTSLSFSLSVHQWIRYTPIRIAEGVILFFFNDFGFFIYNKLKHKTCTFSCQSDGNGLISIYMCFVQEQYIFPFSAIDWLNIRDLTWKLGWVDWDEQEGLFHHQVKWKFRKRKHEKEATARGKEGHLQIQ